MHPIVGVLRLGEGERAFGSYGVMLALAMFVVGCVTVRATVRAREDVGLTFAGLAVTVAGGFFGAWVLFGLVEWARTGSPRAAWEGGGLVFFGAVPGGALALALFSRWVPVRALKILELSLPGLAAGHALGRMGCLLGGCCYGRPFEAPWAVVYAHPLAPASVPAGIARHPAPLYEALGLLTIALVFALAPARRPGDGRRLAAYGVAYGVLRLGVELVRGDAIRGLWFGLVSTSELASALVILAGAAFLWTRRARDPRLPATPVT